MICTRCRTSNFQDYRYCRECGARLEAAPDDAAPATEDGSVDALLHRAFEELERGADQEALGTVEAALALQPESAAAHAALGLVYERQGKIAAAIQQVELALQLNPDSEAERRKLADLRARAAAAAPRRSLTPLQVGIAAATASGALVFAIGLGLATRAPSPASPELAPVAARATEGEREPLPAGTLLPGAPDSAPPAAGTGATAPAPVSRPSAAPASPAPLNPFPAPGSPVVVPTPTPPAGQAPVTTYSGPPRRFGLPPVYDRPLQSSPRGLPPAAIGQIVPLPPPMLPPGAVMQPVQAHSAPAGAPGDGGVAAAAAARQNDSRPAELFEPETGFIRIDPAPAGPAASAAPAAPGGTRTPAARAAAQGPRRPPSISITVSPAPGR